MNRRPRIPVSEPAKQALADIAGEPLAGSECEDEMPDSDLTESGQLYPGAPAWFPNAFGEASGPALGGWQLVRSSNEG